MLCSVEQYCICTLKTRHLPNWDTVEILEYEQNNIDKRKILSPLKLSSLKFY